MIRCPACGQEHDLVAPCPPTSAQTGGASTASEPTAVQRSTTTESPHRSPVETPKKPKEQSLKTLGWILTLGALLVARHAVRTREYYQTIHAQGSVTWAAALACLMLATGVLLLIVGYLKKTGSNE